jgi:hypothetical protein
MNLLSGSNAKREFIDAFSMFKDEHLQHYPALALTKQKISSLLKRTNRTQHLERYRAVVASSPEVADLAKLKWDKKRR